MRPGPFVTAEMSLTKETTEMHPFLILAAAATAAPPLTPSDEQIEGGVIVVTAAREPAHEDKAPVSATVFDRETLEALALPMTSDVLRLSPGVSVAQSGPRGSLTQLRIRGAEANHSLLFVDGIRFNDPAAGNEPRFELLSNDMLSRVEVVRGPQSALWGSEALGGVIAVDSGAPGGRPRLDALAEYGSLDSARAAGRFAAQAGPVAVSGAAGWMRSDGIDSFGGGGDRDGFWNRSASLKAELSPLPGVRIGIVGHWIEGESDYDGLDPVTFQRADTLDATRNRIGAVRGWVAADVGGWSLSADASLLGSSNRNLLAGAPLNRTAGDRTTASAQVSRSLGRHRLTAAVQHETEAFHARDQVYFGGTDQDRRRRLDAVVGEWRAEWTGAFSTDLAVRHDRFSAFADATTVRAAAILTPLPGLRAHAAFGQGIAQPTFYDLYGFFPGSFQGNPGLKPERSAGWEAGLRWSGGKAGVGVTAFANKLQDEILDVFDPATFFSSTANATGKSRRRGLEIDAQFRPSNAVQIGANYTFLDASERKAQGALLVREIRRPRHSANVFATGSAGRLTWGASAAYVGARGDLDFDAFPALRVRLDDYVLASLNAAWRIGGGLEAFARVENALGEHYQDVVGYATAGRTVNAGLRVRLGG
jgi:vitamin B12 transporter